jgi:predicted nucleic acid-binding protein
LLAADLHQQYKHATADSIVYAPAKHMDADLLTFDPHVEGVPDVTLLPKSA